MKSRHRELFSMFATLLRRSPTFGSVFCGFCDVFCVCEVVCAGSNKGTTTRYPPGATA